MTPSYSCWFLFVSTYQVLDSFKEFSELWNEEPDEKVTEFMAGKPLLSEIEAQIKYYQVSHDWLQVANWPCNIYGGCSS